MRRLGIRMWHIALETQINAGIYEIKTQQKQAIAA